ncbi:hypothetical protein [Brevibacterium litoralis]|uniref:hypothetical protein n=1 Tax=Brevibacterium litoralis TaxID=3138935 RepID=UPI0032ECD9C5
MTFIGFASAKGAPGVTTLSLLSAALWPRTCVLADADVAGGDIAYQMPLEDGRAVSTDRGLMSLMPLARKHLDPGMVPEHTQRLMGGTELLAGMPEPEQARAVENLWPAVGTAFSGLTSHDVLADLGALTPASPHLGLAREADALVFVLRPRPAQVLQTRARLLKLRDLLPGATPRFGVVVVAPHREARDAQNAAAMLGEDVLRFTDYLGHLALDPVGASMFDGKILNRPERTLLVRSGVPVIEQVAALGGVRLDPGAVAAALGTPVKPTRRSRRGKKGAPDTPAAEAPSAVPDSTPPRNPTADTPAPGTPAPGTPGPPAATPASPAPSQAPPAPAAPPQRPPAPVRGTAPGPDPAPGTPPQGPTSPQGPTPPQGPNPPQGPTPPQGPNPQQGPPAPPGNPPAARPDPTPDPTPDTDPDTPTRPLTRRDLRGRR